MNAIKEDVISLVSQMPEYSTLEDIMEHLYVMQKILKGKKLMLVQTCSLNHDVWNTSLTHTPNTIGSIYKIEPTEYSPTL
jgi:hypothetical protein